MKRFKVFLFNSLLMIIGNLLLQVIRLIFGIYISNKISAEALGVFGLIMTTYMFGITLAASGVNISCTRVISEEMAYGNDYAIKVSSRKCLTIAMFLSIFASALFYFNADSIVTKFFESKVSVNIVYLICIALPLISISAGLDGYFRGIKYFVVSIPQSLLNTLLTVNTKIKKTLTKLLYHSKII